MFEVDRKGLRQILERRGKQFALLELIQNAWDQKVTKVDITFTKLSGDRRAFLRVVDNDPEGFADLSHAYTLFAPSTKKADPKQRGRFNLGEKLVIALCEVSRIMTTTGAFEFSGSQRKPLRNKRTESGSVFEGEILMTREEFDLCCEAIHQVLPPVGIDTYFNGDLIERREPFATIHDHSLRTEIADHEGFLRPTTRKTDVMIYQALPGETGMLYEMGIPVVETGDDFHVDIQQKVPLNMDRDNVTPAYLRTVRTAVVNEVSRHLDGETANHTWVTEALASPDITDRAVQDVIGHRFGDKAVSFDPSDPEANHRAVAAGYTVVAGRSLDRSTWANVRRAGALLPAGRVTPSAKAFDENGPPYKILEPKPHELQVIEGVRRIAKALLGFDIRINLASSPNINAQAAYGGRTLMFNKLRLPRGFFDNGISEYVVDLTIHELGHEFSSNHLDETYYHALTRLGAKLVFLAAADPSLLTLACQEAKD